MVEPSFLAETCTPSSFWPEAEVIEPVSNWSAEAVLAAPTRTRLATLANNWPRICVIVFLSFTRLFYFLRIGAPERLALGMSTSADRSDLPILIFSETIRTGIDAVLKVSVGQVPPSKSLPTPNHKFCRMIVTQQSSLPTLSISVPLRRPQGKCLPVETPILPACGHWLFNALFAGCNRDSEPNQIPRPRPYAASASLNASRARRNASTPHGTPA